MRSEKKAFKVVYELIADGVITDKEAFNLVEGIFEKEYYPVPVPTVMDNEENPTEKSTDNMGFMVKGFAPLK